MCSVHFLAFICEVSSVFKSCIVDMHVYLPAVFFSPVFADTLLHLLVHYYILLISGIASYHWQKYHQSAQDAQNGDS